MAEQKITRSRALELLKEKQEELNRLGEDRYPKRSDFSDAQVVAIKAFFGPWPRALEAAGLKEPKPIAPKSAKRKKSATKPKKQAISAHQKLERRRAKQEDEKSSPSDNTK